MACKRAKAERSAAKDARQLPAAETPVKKRSPGKKKKPINVEYRCKPERRPNYWLWREWSRMGRYRTVEEAETAVENDKHKHPGMFEYRIQGQENSKK